MGVQLDQSNNLPSMIKNICFQFVKIYCAFLIIAIISIAQMALLEMQIKDPLERPHQIKYTDYTTILNYPTQEYNVTTEDGYIINIIRIQAKNTTIQELGKPPVLMYFGLNCAIEVFSMNKEEQSPTFFVANQGYDVWMIANRGTQYSSGHVNLTQNDPEYWSFSWQEMAEYDFRSAFDFIYEKVGRKKISTIGFSQGTTILLAALADFPNYQQKITQMILMGPTANIINQNSPAFTLGITIGGAPLLKRLGINKLVDEYKLLYYGTKYLSNLAHFILSQITDSNVTVLNQERFQYFMATYPGGTSVQVYDHWQQLATETDQFRKYDYRNVTKNMLKYGSEVPPIYNLQNIKVPTHLFVGRYDRLGSPEDAKILYESLKLSSVNATMQMYDGGHLYFAIGRETPYLSKLSQILIDQHPADN
ncbi:hypothetical protein ABPG74_011959 [Tetrahymena malaccensis]